MWHAIIVLQLTSLITSAIQWLSSTKRQDPLRLQIGEAPPHHRDLCPSLSWDIQTWKKLPILKIHTFYRRKIPLLLNLTQFYTPGNNPNLKNEFIWKTPFSKNKDPCPTIGHKYQTGQKKEQQMRNQNNRLCSILAIRTTLRF